MRTLSYPFYLRAFVFILSVWFSTSSKAQCLATFNMNTPYNSNNGQRGCMFDVTATNDVTITCIESNLYAGTTANYEIYYKTGTHVGSENNAAAWTLLGSTSGLTSAGNNVPTYIPITFTVPILAGQTVAFYVTNDFGGGTTYTDGTAVGNFLASDANLTVYEGIGKSYPFGLTFNVRNFNGHLYYETGIVVLPIELLDFTAEPINRSVKTEWTTASEKNNNYFTVERSKDGENWEGVAAIPGAGNSSSLKNYSAIDEDPYSGRSFYRLKQTDFDGQWTYSSIETVFIEPSINMEIYPNPSNGILNLSQIPEEGPYHIQLYDMVGRVVYEQQTEEPLSKISLSHLPAGQYIFRFANNNFTHQSTIILQK